MKKTVLKAQNKRVKMGKTSITILDDGFRTCGVLTRVKQKNSIPPRIIFDLHQKFSQAGISLTQISKNIVMIGDDIFYLNDLSLQAFIDKTVNKENESLFSFEIQRNKERIEIVENLKNVVDILDCYIVL